MTALILTIIALVSIYAPTMAILWARASYASSQCAIAMDDGDMRLYHYWSQESSRRRNLAMRVDVLYRGLDRYQYRKTGRHHGS